MTRNIAVKISDEKNLPARTVLGIMATDLVTSDGTSLSADRIVASATVGRDGRSVGLSICIAPGKDANAGRYVGSVAFDDHRANGSAPVNVTIKANQSVPIALVIIGALAGMGWSMLIAAALQLGGALQKVRLGIVCVGACVLGAVPTYFTYYDANAAFGGSSNDYWRICAAAFVAAAAAFPTLAGLARVIPGNQPNPS